MAKPPKTEKPNPFPGIEPGYLMKPKTALALWKAGKLMGFLQYLQIDYILAGTVSDEGRPEWLSGKAATAAVMAKALGFSVTFCEESLADAAARGLIARRKVRGAWQYKVAWEKWADVPKYEPKKPEEPPEAKPVVEVPELHDAKQFVVKPGKFRFPVVLAEAVAKFDLAGDIPYGLRFQYDVRDGTLQVNVFGGEEKAKQTPSPPGVAPSPFIDSKELTVSNVSKKAKSNETPPDALEAWAQSVLAAYLREPVPRKILAKTRANLGNVPVAKLAERWELRKKKYTAHGLLPGLALDVARADRQAKSTVTQDQMDQVERLLKRGLGPLAVIEQLRISKHQFEEILAQIEGEAPKTHGAGGA